VNEESQSIKRVCGVALIDRAEHTALKNSYPYNPFDCSESWRLHSARTREHDVIDIIVNMEIVVYQCERSEAAGFAEREKSKQ
jgi:hypothetical protein